MPSIRKIAIGYINLGNISKTKTAAGGFGGQGGIMITPVKQFNFTALYSTEIIARGTTRDLKTHYSHIDEARLPDYLLIGINLKPTDTLSIQASYQLTFSQQRNFGSSYAYDFVAGKIVNNFVYSSLLGEAGGNIQDYKMKMAHKVCLGGELQVHKMLALSIGGSFESQDTHPRAQVPFDPGLANVGVGLGMKITPIERFSIQLGAAKYFYFTEKMIYNEALNFTAIKMNKSVWSFGIGLTGKII